MNGEEDRNDDRAFVDRSRQLFDDSVQALDGETRSRLTTARHEALAAAAGRRTRLAAWIPASGVATAGVVALLIFSGHPTTEDIDGASSAGDVEILLMEDNLEMLEELDFYSWMDLAGDDAAPEPANNVG